MGRLGQDLMPIHPYRPNVFAGSPLDRLDHRRKDTAWVEQRRTDAAAVFVAVWRTRVLVTSEKAAPRAGYLPMHLAQPYLDLHPWAMLGQHAGGTVFAIDLSSLDPPDLNDLCAAGRFEDLRRIGTILPDGDAAILAHARGLMHWRTRHRFCGVCGAACMPQSAGHVLACAGCGAQHFPRTDPAVIMLVTHGERALLGQPARFRDLRMFTTLAGFVEPGESLEEAVAREVHEEAGVRVGNVRYASSQPWPFPASIMLGFTAEAEDDALCIDDDELVEARWFTRGEARACDGFMLPPDMSIARRLIEQWLSDA